MTSEDINRLIGIKESYELPEKLIKILLNEKQKELLFDECLKLNNNLKVDFFRDYFQEQHSDRKGLKQDYTPDCICELLAMIYKSCDKVLDCCSGTGALSISAYNNNQNCFIECEEYSSRSLPILLFNLSLRNINAIVKQCDVLTKEVFHIYKLSKSEKYSVIEEIQEYTEEKFELIVSNPPYSINWNPIIDDRFIDYDLAPKSKADYAFILDILYRLKENGQALIILPTGVLFRGSAEGNIRKKFLENNLIDTIIALPDKLFMNTSIPVIILVIKKNRENKDILFINASKEFIKQGKQNLLSFNQMTKIVDTYDKRLTIEYYSRKVTLREIKDNNYNLNIPRYVDTYKEKADQRSIDEIMQEIIDLENEIHDNVKSFNEMVHELQGTTPEAEKYARDLKSKYDELQEINNIDVVKELKNSINTVLQEIENANFEWKWIYELATIERAQKNKEYPKGCTIIQISATKGECLYLEDSQQIEAKYAVIIPNENIDSNYLYWSIEGSKEKWFAKVIQDLNISIEDVNNIPIKYYSDIMLQKKMTSLFSTLSTMETNVFAEMENHKAEKSFLLESMFPKNEKKIDYSQE